MKIAILSQDGSLYSTKRLKEAGEQRGHQMYVIDYLRCYININSKKPMVIYEGKSLQKFDAIIPRIAASKTFYGTAIVRQFEMMGIFTINESQAISRSRNKLISLQLLGKEGINLPSTVFSNSAIDTDSLIKLVGGTPVVIKILEGTQGMGVILADTHQVAKSVIEGFRGVNVEVLVQKFIHEANGCDLRCFVVGDKVVAAIKRKSAAGEFRSNLHRGGTAEKVKLTPQERSIAVAAAKAMGLKLAGVDLLRSEQGPVVIEVNSSPGLEGIETTTQIDVSGKIIEFLEKNALKGKKNN